MQRLQFWFVYGSTYSYLSVARIARLAAERQVSVDWQPFSLLPILAERGMDKGPFLPFPDKLNYMWRDLERRASRHGLEYKRPVIYPPASRLTMRIGVLAAKEGWCREFTEVVFRLHWTEGRYIGTDENLATALEAVGKSLEATIAAASDPTMDTAVDAQVARAKELGIFGAPSFTIGNELFWGDDRLEEALEWAASNHEQTRSAA